MNKRTFIPKSFRPLVPGSKLKEPGIKKASFAASQYFSDAILIISARDDIVPQAFLRELDSREKIFPLSYDDLGATWDFAYQSRSLRIFSSEGVIVPKSIYQRHPGITQDHPHYERHLAFFEVIDLWHGNMLGQTRDHHHNFSKIYQGITSIRNAQKKMGGQAIKYPRSFFLKGNAGLLKGLSGDLIVKSCSNIRSQAVSKEVFDQWDPKNLNNLPTLFQEKVCGRDVRVHLCGNHLWSLLIASKDNLDYRYSSKGSVSYQEVSLPDVVIEFCKSISQEEKNKLIGVDLILSDKGCFCLESNPGPGWSTFHHSSKKKFAQAVFKELSYVKN
jgi:hypothetical protein